MTPEAKARQTIDALLVQAGWHVCDMANAHIHAARGVALREFPLNTGYGFADSGNNQQALNKRLVKQIPLPLPLLAEQQRIVAEVDRRLSLVRSVESEVDANLKRVRALRQPTLSKAFSVHQ